MASSQGLSDGFLSLTCSYQLPIPDSVYKVNPGPPLHPCQGAQSCDYIPCRGRVAGRSASALTVIVRYVIELREERQERMSRQGIGASKMRVQEMPK